MDFSDARSIQQGQLLADAKIDQMKQAVGSAGEVKEGEKLKSLARQFESIMTLQLLTAMRATVPKSTLTGGFSTDMYQSMMDQEVANEISKEKGMGLADMVHRQLIHLDQNAKARNMGPGEPLSASLPTTNPAKFMELNESGIPLKTSDFHALKPTSGTGSMMKAVKSYRGNQ